VRTVERCPLCGTDVRRSAERLFVSSDYISGDTFNVMKCRECGMAYTDPCPDQENEFARYYPREEYYGSDEGARFNSPMERMITTFRRQRAERILRSKTAGRVLDIGCGRGLFLRRLKSDGWECHGTELSADLASYLQNQYGLDVRVGSVQSCGFEDRSLDVVTIYHVLEHISDPMSTLREVRRIIRDDGLLVIGVPNFAGMQSVLSGPEWFHLDVPRHVVHFTPATLRRAVEDAGFEIVSRRNFSAEYDPYGLIQSLLNRLGCRRNFLYEVLRTKGIGRSGAKTWLYDVPLSLVLPPFAFAPAFAVEFALSAVGRNGTMEIVCRPLVA